LLLDNASKKETNADESASRINRLLARYGGSLFLKQPCAAWAGVDRRARPRSAGLGLTRACGGMVEAAQVAPGGVGFIVQRFEVREWVRPCLMTR
jgi:hypothetical protein